MLNEEGEPNEENPLRGDARAVRALFVKAAKKDVRGLPYLIFVDINAPGDRGTHGFDKEWAKGVRRWMARFDQPINGLFVTDFAPHYRGDDLASPGEWFRRSAWTARSASPFFTLVRRRGHAYRRGSGIR